VSGYAERARTVLAEISEAVLRVDDEQVDALVAELVAARSVTVVGVGREGLAIRAFAMRLMHAGLDAHWVWDDAAPAVRPGDLVLAISGSGQIGHVDHVVRRAGENGARVAVVTAQPSGVTAARADVVVRIPAAAYGATDDAVASIQPMGSLFEQVALVTFDLVLLEVVDRLGHDLGALAHRHRNVE
jgi:6-phospho-3-hexuloisomerase